MRSVTDFTNAIEMLVGQAVAQCSAEQLEAIGSILIGLGGAAHGSAALKRAGMGLGAPAFAPGPESPQPVSGGVTPRAPSAPAPTQPSEAKPPGTLLPVYKPPSEDVHCEEAHRQRNEPHRIPGLRGDPVAFCEQILYYLSQIGATANTIPKDDPLCGAKIDEIMLSIECLPGTRPGGTGTIEDETIVRQIWSDCYSSMKDLAGRKLLDHDDEQQILYKLGDRPGGAMDAPDFTNEDLKPAPTPGLVTVTQVKPEPAVPPPPTPKPASATDAPPPPPVPEHPQAGGSVKFGRETIDIPADQGRVPPAPPPQPSEPVAVPPGATVVGPGQTVTVHKSDGTPLDLTNKGAEPIFVTPEQVEEHDLPEGVSFPEPEPAPAAADQPSETPSS
jgi:hypothetical protein